MTRHSKSTTDEIRRLKNRIELLEIDKSYYLDAYMRAYVFIEKLWDIYEGPISRADFHAMLSTHTVVDDASFHLWCDKRDRTKSAHRQVAKARKVR